MSHSYPVWPSHELSWENNEEQMKAMRVALEKRLPQDWSGHNFAIRAFCAARTKYPQLFWLNINRLMRYDFIQTNLITRHNPRWCANTDVLCGLPAMLTEALIYSKPGEIELLPAWNTEFPKGSVEGIATRTQAIVKYMDWDLNKKEVNVSITSLKDQQLRLVARQGIKSISANAKIKEIKGDNISSQVSLKKGELLQVKVVLESNTNSYPVNMPALTAKDADKQFLIKKEESSKR